MGTEAKNSIRRNQVTEKKNVKIKPLFVPRTILKSSVPSKEWDEFNSQQKAAISKHIKTSFTLGCAEMGIKMPD